MKLELPLTAPQAALVQQLAVAAGDSVVEGETLVLLLPLAADEAPPPLTAVPAVSHPGLTVLQARRALLANSARPEAVARRQAQGRRTARENVAALLDAGSVTEYGALAIAAQRSRRALEDL
jgi:multidrug efflux pump subunit AcrA (membrane-fusion protein)